MVLVGFGEGVLLYSMVVKLAEESAMDDEARISRSSSHIGLCFSDLVLVICYVK